MAGRGGTCFLTSPIRFCVQDAKTKLQAVLTLRSVSIAADTSPIFVRTELTQVLLSSLRQDLQSLHHSRTASSASTAAVLSKPTAPEVSASSKEPSSEVSKLESSVKSAQQTVSSPTSISAVQRIPLNSEQELAVGLVREQAQLLYHLSRQQVSPAHAVVRSIDFSLDARLRIWQSIWLRKASSL